MISASFNLSGKVPDSRQSLKHVVKNGAQILAAYLRISTVPLTDFEMFRLKMASSTSACSTLVKSNFSSENRWEFISLMLGWLLKSNFASEISGFRGRVWYSQDGISSVSVILLKYEIKISAADLSDVCKTSFSSN